VDRHEVPVAARAGRMSASAPAELVARVVELEMRLAFQDQTLSELNTVVTDQARRLNELESRLQRTVQDLGTVRGLLYSDPSTEPPPPHY
jgi:SlyX protein